MYGITINKKLPFHSSRPLPTLNIVFNEIPQKYLGQVYQQINMSLILLNVCNVITASSIIMCKSKYMYLKIGILIINK